MRCTRSSSVAWYWLSLVLAFCLISPVGSLGVVAKEVAEEDNFREAIEQAVGDSGQSADGIVRELFQLQQQLGGSVVEGRPQLEDLQPLPGTAGTIQRYQPPHHTIPPDVTLLSDPMDQAPVTQHRPNAFPNRAGTHSATKVGELREAAWQMDGAAHRLEQLDLYEQADAIRAVAAKLRRDARLMKQRGGQMRGRPQHTPAAGPQRGHRVEPPRR